MADQVDVDETTQLVSLLERVAAGEEIVIAQHGHPVARLVPEQRQPDGPRPRRTLGGMEGKVHYLGDWDEADEDIANLILGEPSDS